MPITQRLKTSRAIKLATSKSELARMLGITRQSVGKWGVWVPPLRFFELQKLKPEWFEGESLLRSATKQRNQLRAAVRRVSK